MRRRVTVLVAMILAMTLTACGNPRYFNKDGIHDWEKFNEYNEDCHVVYAQTRDACFSDGSFEADMLFNSWVNRYKEIHE